MIRDDDFELQTYQDDLDVDDDAVDPFMAEKSDDPTAILGIPPYEFGKELEKGFGDEDEIDDDDIDIHDDQREAVEDQEPEENIGSP